MSGLTDHPADEAAQVVTHRYSRRRFLGAMGGAAAAAAFLAACGSEDDPEPTETSTTTATTTATETGAAGSTSSATSTSTSEVSTPTASGSFPVTVPHKYGETEVSEAPQRVLSLGYSDQDAILAVGVTPVATRYWFGDEPGAIFPWAQDLITGETPEVLEMRELDFEKIASLQPDLIVAVYSGITAEDYATLSEIAPVVAQSPDYIDYGMPWDEAARLIATALGRLDAMETIISDVEAQYAAAREEHPEFEGKRMVVAAMRADGQVGVYAEQDGRARVFSNLGFVSSDALDGLFGDSFFKNISAEQFNLLDSGDVVAWTQVDYTSPEAILENEVYRQLSVAQEGRHILIKGYADMAFSFNSVLSLPYAIDAVVPSLVAALDGDPATNVEVAVA